MKKKSCKTCDWKLDNGRKLPILHKDIKKDVKLAGQITIVPFLGLIFNF